MSDALVLIGAFLGGAVLGSAAVLIGYLVTMWVVDRVRGDR